MSTTTYATAGYRDAAEAFALVATRLQSSESPPTRLEMSQWSQGDRTEIERLRDEIVGSGAVPAAMIDTGAFSPRSDFQLLLAIDRAFATITPDQSTQYDGRMRKYRGILERLGRYNPDESLGWVLRRRSWPTRPKSVPDSLDDHLTALVYSPDPSRALHLTPLPPELDFPDAASKNADSLVVGCVPFFSDLDELLIERIENSGEWYRIKVKTNGTGWEEPWRNRIRTTLQNLDDSGAHLGVIPELALDHRLLELWRDALLYTPRPAGSSLQWILVGTGPVSEHNGQQANTAVVLDRIYAELIVRQDKCEPFTLDDDSITKWGLKPELGDGPLAEWMREGRDRFVIEANPFRLAILVCEDHARLEKVGAELVPVAPTMLLVPVFAPPIIEFRWQQQAAMRFADATGSSTVVATNCAINTKPPPKGSAGTALALWPKSAGSGWNYEVKNAGGDPTQVVTFNLPWS